MKLTLAEAALTCGAKLEAPASATGVGALTAQGYSIDSRTVAPGELFFAVRGERLDGHDFIANALDRGAIAAVVSLARVASLPDKVLAEAADRDRVDPNILAKIAARPRLGESVTDVLLKRGGLPLQRKILDNPDARISEGGFARVIMGLDGDKELAQAVAARNDLPPELRLWLKDILGQ